MPVFEDWNARAAWIGIFLGCAAGALQLLCFHRDEWLGGYASWTNWPEKPYASSLLLVAALTMPLACYLSAWRAGLRRLFAIPALCLTAATGMLAWKAAFS